MKSHFFIRPHLFVGLIALALSMSCARDEMSPSIPDEGVDEIEVGADPEFIVEERPESNSRIGTVTLGMVSVYLSKDDGAYGKVYMKIYDKNEKLVYKSGAIDVSAIKTSSESAKKHTHFYCRPKKTVNIHSKYRVEVHCQGCSDASANEPGVYWWASRGSYGRAVYISGNRWLSMEITNFALSTGNLKSDGSPYGDVSQIGKGFRLPVNDPSILYGQTFQPSDGQPCDVFDKLSIENISVTNYDEETFDKEVTFDIINQTDEEVFIGDLIFQRYLSNDPDAKTSTIPAGGAILSAYDANSIQPGERKTIHAGFRSQGYQYLSGIIKYAGGYEEGCSKHFSMSNF